MSSQAEQATRRPPGILAVLKETLTYYPYRNSDGKRQQHVHKRRGGKRQSEQNIITIEEFGCRTELIPDKPLGLINADNTINKNGFSLFFFVDSNNRQSLKAIPIVSKWCNYALNCSDSDDINNSDDNI